MICCDIKLNNVTRLILGRNLVKLLILLISFIKNLFLRPKKSKHFSEPEEQPQHFKSSKTILGSTITNTSLRTHQFYFCLQRALGSTTTRLKFQFRVGALLKSPSNYLELIYEIDFLLELLQYHDKTFSFPRKSTFFLSFTAKLNFLSK